MIRLNLKTKNYLNFLDVIACQLGKHVKLSFTSSTSVLLFPFELIHSDVWISLIKSLSGVKYYVIFVDDFSHYVWVYSICAKSDVFDKFVHVRNFFNKQFNMDIKYFQCYNGGEYGNHKFHTFFSQNGIVLCFSCPHTSQQNGKAECMLCTLNNVIHTLLFLARLPPAYWTRSLHMAVYLINILPSTSLHNETPFYKLYHKHPSYDHLYVFGCLCYPYTNASHKLDPRSTPCIFLGYPTNYKGHCCLNLDTSKIIISQNVVFDELIFPFG